jgi:hypothetical protein
VVFFELGLVHILQDVYIDLFLAVDEFWEYELVAADL